MWFPAGSRGRGRPVRRSHGDQVTCRKGRAVQGEPHITALWWEAFGLSECPPPALCSASASLPDAQFPASTWRPSLLPGLWVCAEGPGELTSSCPLLAGIPDSTASLIYSLYGAQSCHLQLAGHFLVYKTNMGTHRKEKAQCVVFPARGGWQAPSHTGDFGDEPRGLRGSWRAVSGHLCTRSSSFFLSFF